MHREVGFVVALSLKRVSDSSEDASNLSNAAKLCHAMLVLTSTLHFDTGTV